MNADKPDQRRQGEPVIGHRLARDAGPGHAEHRKHKNRARSGHSRAHEGAQADAMRRREMIGGLVG